MNRLTLHQVIGSRLKFMVAGCELTTNNYQLKTANPKGVA